MKPPDAVAGGSFEPGANVGLDRDQLAQASRALTVADRLHAKPLPVLAMVVAALGESNFRAVPNRGGSGYCGVFQAHPNNIACSNTELQARSFLKGGRGFQAGGAIRLARTVSDPGVIATRVEASGKPGSFYGVHRPQATKIIEAWHQGAIESTIPFGAGAAAIEAAAEQLDGMGIPYQFGGGHANPAVPSPGLDCSSSLAWVFQHAGFTNFPTMTSGMMMGWGEPGPGKWGTIFANETHVFMRIGKRYFGTSAFGHPGAGTGPHFFSRNPSAAYLAGFTQRHPPGL